MYRRTLKPSSTQTLLFVLIGVTEQHIGISLFIPVSVRYISFYRMVLTQNKMKISKPSPPIPWDPRNTLYKQRFGHMQSDEEEKKL